jgi:hypothetical protein
MPGILRVAALIKRGTHDVLTPRWIFDSIDIGFPLPVEPRYSRNSLVDSLTDQIQVVFTRQDRVLCEGEH